MLHNEAKEATGDLTIRMIAMPSNTNAAGDVFGGWVMSQMDLAASTAAFGIANVKCATVAIDKVSFLAPMIVGDELSVYTKIAKVGRTSITVDVEAWRRLRHTPETQMVTRGRFVFVALDENNRPTPVVQNEDADA
ncbi:acyl-CoA thioesterase [Acetobacter sp. DsW_063]|uniref:acyl-CoA thioesterase n=1 Tax=Acetobacter sp. DsW_063 TaxID=1514894 RepID=UPI000A3AFBDC|nr:acyl-CoA thioesterase [Acetobacter sp. DsW_063]OUJ14474.1 acyl-CoA thioester hydrolase [Acetobacter sp. DsW_063]